MVAGGEVLSLEGDDVGIINSPCYSHQIGKSLALAHISPNIKIGTVLKVSGDGIDTTATFVSSQIYDLSKSRTHA